MTQNETEILVIGAGLTGTKLAAEASKTGASVAVWSKGPCASIEIMGLNTVVDQKDSVDCFYNDLIKSGYGLNNNVLAYNMAKESLEAAKDIERIGLSFNRNDDSKLNVVQTLGCEYPRLIHVNSYTGRYALGAYNKICKENKVKEERITAVELVKNNGRIVGAIGIDEKHEMIYCRCKAVVMTTGGCSRIYNDSTYPEGIEGDGYAMAYRAGAELIDMEFQQYEPCCFVKPDSLRGKVAVTTLLLEGGKLLNKDKQEFIKSGYKMQKSELVKIIGEQIFYGNGTDNNAVYYDVTNINEKRLKVDHAMYYNPAKQSGIDLTTDYGEVAPMAHTCIGGIRIDEGCHSTIKGLFAAGEAAGGIHGANRIGGCSGTETLTYSSIAARSILEYVKETEYSEDECFEIKNGTNAEDFDEILVSLKSKINEGLGIIKEGKSLQKLIDCLESEIERITASRFKDGKECLQRYRCLNIATVALMQAKSSLERKESRGVFIRADYPETDKEYEKNIVVRNIDGEMKTY